MGKSAHPISDEIWGILKEVSAGHKKAQKEIEEIRAIHKRLSTSHEKAKKEMEEIRAGQKELTTSQKETNEQMSKTDARMNKVIGDWGNRWGKLGENLVKGSLVQRLNERGIKVERILTNAKSGGLEFDIIAINGKEVVVVEVKATLDPSDVDKFSENIKKFTTLWPEFKERVVYGAMAFLMKANKQADSLAQKRGFFVISATGDIIIQNDKDFKAKDFS